MQALNSTGANTTLHELVTVATADGTQKVIDITINGANDAAVISGTSGGTVVEAGGVANGTPGTPTAPGDLLATDVDNAADAFQAVAAGAATANGYGTYGMTASGVWTYTLNNSNGNVQALNVGESLSDSFTVYSADGTAQFVNITISGADDQPTLAAVSAGSIGEVALSSSTIDSGLAGTLIGADVDLETLTYGIQDGSVAGGEASLAGSYGTLTVNTSTGAYTYAKNAAAIEALRAGATASDALTVTITDGDDGPVTRTYTVNLTGANDGPALSDATDPAAVLELGNATAQNLAPISGSFSVTDVDVGDTLTASVVGSPAVKLNGAAFPLPAGAAALTATGVFSLTNAVQASVGGALLVNYTYDPAAANLDFLGATDSLTITYAVKVNDGLVDSATQDVTFIITGTNDAGTDIKLAITATPANNSAPSGAFAQFSTIDPDGGGATTYGITSFVEKNWDGTTVSDSTQDLTISPGGALSGSSVDNTRIYEFTVTATQDTTSFSETFSLITGSVGNDTIGIDSTGNTTGTAANGDDALYALNGGDTIYAGSGDDTVAGQNGTDQIHGETGNDTLIGGGGNDTFYFDTALDAVTNVDTITDFNASADLIALSKGTFADLTTPSGTLSAAEFATLAGSGGTNSVGAGVHIIYDSTTGNLYYDSDGGSSLNRTLFATLTGVSGTLDQNDITVGP